jgi:hypothetical protein
VNTDIQTKALEAVRAAAAEVRAGEPGPLKLRAIKHLRDATGKTIPELVGVIDEAIEQHGRVDLSRFLVKSQRSPGRWLYRFPNGHEASVIVDLHRPFRFEVLSDDPADKNTGRLATGLSTAEVEAKLVAIYNLPAAEKE